MKSVILLLLFLFTAIQLFAQKENPDYDSELPKKPGSNYYGVRMYVLVIFN